MTPQVFGKNQEPEWFQMVRTWRRRALEFNRWLFFLTVSSVFAYIMIVLVYSAFVTTVLVKSEWKARNTFSERVTLITQDYIGDAVKENLAITAEPLNLHLKGAGPAMLYRLKMALADRNVYFFHFLVNGVAFTLVGIAVSYTGLLYTALLIPLLVLFATKQIITAELYNQLIGPPVSVWMIVIFQVVFMILAVIVMRWFRNRD